MKKILIVNSNYYSKISKNLVIGAKRKLHNTKFKISDDKLLAKFISESEIMYNKNSKG